MRASESGGRSAFSGWMSPFRQEGSGVARRRRLHGFIAVAALSFASLVVPVVAPIEAGLLPEAAAATVTCTPSTGYTNCVRLTFSGANQTWTVPAGVEAVKLQVWGAGGGGIDSDYWPSGSTGAAGGYSEGILPVKAGNQLTAVVGGGGANDEAISAFGGGGPGGKGKTVTAAMGNTAGGAGGGGYSGVFLGTISPANARIIAGGGGGASPGADRSTPADMGSAAVGPYSGGGGGLTGGQDTVPLASGRGGTQTAGGAGATNTQCQAATAGSQFQGGTGGTVSNFEGGGGGGAGWYGGGGGACQTFDSVDTNPNGTGGGGSAYLHSSLLSSSTTAGSNGVWVTSTTKGGKFQGPPAPKNTDPQYVAGVAEGGDTVPAVAPGETFNGGNGLVVIQYVLPTLTLQKTQTNTLPSPVTAGSKIDYQIAVTKTGSFPASAPTITDPKCDATPVLSSGDANSDNRVDVGETWVYTCSHVLTQTEVDSGTYINVASASANTVYPDGSTVPITATPVTPGADTVTTTWIRPTDLTVSATSPTGVVPGTSTTVTLTATNNGPSSVTNPTTVTYAAPGGATITAAPAGCAIAADKLSVSCVIASIANGASSSLAITVAVPTSATPGSTLTGSNNVTLTNTAADSTPGNNTASSSITVAAPKLKIVKSAGAPTTSKGATTTQVDGGDTILYTFTVTNTGTAPIVGATVVDAKCDSGSLSPTSAGIAVNASQTFTCTHTLTQAEVNSGSFVNTASVTGADTAGNASATDGTSTLSTTTTFTRVAQTEIVKSAATPRTGPGNNSSSTIQKGDLIDYTFTVTNTGNTTLTNVGITDAKCDATPVLLPLPSTTTSLASLAPGQTVQFGCIHTITQTDINGGGAVNTASVTATPPTGTTLTSATTSQPSTTTAIKQVSEYTLTKTSTGTTVAAGTDPSKVDAGDTITYQFLVKATGNLDLANVTVTDAKCDSGTLSPASVASLVVGASTTFTCTHTVTQANMDAGQLVNVATVAATSDAAGVTVNATVSTTSDSTETVTLTPNGVVKMVKSAGTQTIALGASSSVTDAGDKISYSFAVTNTGSVTLNTIAVTDAKCDTGTISPASIASLAPGASATVTCTHTITATEYAALSVTNTASISAKTPSGAAATTDGTSVLSVTTPISAPVDLETTVSGPGTVEIGSTGTMTVKVDNLGSGNAVADATTTVTAPTGTFITAYTVPAGVTCTPASPIAAPGATTVTCTIPKAQLEVSDPAVSLAMTISVPSTVTFNTSLATGGASTTSSNPDPNTTNNAAASSGTAVDTTPPAAPVITGPANGFVTNQPVTTISGTGTPGDTISTITVNGTAVTCANAPVTVSAGGTWSCTLTTPIPDEGTYAVVATEKDPAGNSTPSAQTTFTIDTTPPATPVVTGPADGFITNQPVTAISGTGTAGDTISSITVNGVEVACTTPVTVGAGGTWTCTLEAPISAEGTYAVIATEKDPAGNTTPSAPVSFTVDTTPPSLSATSPPLTNDATPPISGKSDQPDGATVTVTRPDPANPGQSLAVCTATVTSGAWTCSPATGLPDGSYTFTATTVDAAHNSTSTSTTTVIDATPPAPKLVIDAVTADNVLNAAEAGADVLITGTVSGEFMPGDLVTLTVNGVDYPVTVGADGKFSIAVPGSALANDSDLTIDGSVSSTDAAGNTGTGSAQKTYQVDIAAPVPTIAVDNVTADNVLNAAEAGADVGITGTVGGDFVAGDTVTLTVNGKTFTGPVAADGTFSIAVPGADLKDDPDSTVAASVSTKDAAGNPGSASTTKAYTVDIAVPVPTIAVDKVTDDNVLNAAEAGADVAITGTVGGDFVAGDTVTLTVNGKTFTGPVAADGTFSIAVPGADLAADPDSTVAASVSTTDAAGNPGSASTTKAYTVDIAVPVPTIAVDKVTDDNVLNAAEAGADVAITGTVGGDFVAGDTVTLTVNGKTFTGPVAADGTFSIAVPGADLKDDPDSTVAASVSTTDAAGNPGSAKTTKAYTVDTKAPVAPEITGPVPGLVTNQDVTSVSGTGTAGDTITTVTVDGTPVACTNAPVTVSADGTWSCTLSTPISTDGPHTIVATETDPAGNSTPSAPVTVTIDKIPPAVPEITGPVPGLVTNQDVTTVSGNGTAGDTITSVTVDGTPVACTNAPVTVAADGTWSCTLSTPISTDGPHTIVATETDPAGNTTPSAPVTVTIDKTPPVVTLTIDPLPALEGYVIDITGTVGGDFTEGDTVTLVVNGVTYTGTVDANGDFVIPVATSDLIQDPDTTIDGSVTTKDPAGNAGTATATETYPADSDGDGIPDKVEVGDPTNPVDTDGDGTPDYLDTDSDGDGIPDSVEAGADPTKPVDTDGDGLPDYRDLDSDNDGVPDKVEGTADSDGDGIPNYIDARSATISGHVFHDQNRDTVLNAGEPDISLVDVQLIDAATGTVLDTQTTRSPFLFKDVANGAYIVRVVEGASLAGWTATTEPDRVKDVAMVNQVDVTERNFGYYKTPGLPQTGTNASDVATGAAALIGLGGLLLLVARRRREEQEQSA
jgi:uncharacterized repeat protein (TIGR01451 family)/LPXTG-motif cell wall-anchored protein